MTDIQYLIVKLREREAMISLKKHWQYYSGWSEFFTDARQICSEWLSEWNSLKGLQVRNTCEQWAVSRHIYIYM